MFFGNGMFSKSSTGFYGFSTGYYGFSTGSLRVNNFEQYVCQIKKNQCGTVKTQAKPFMGPLFTSSLAGRLGCGSRITNLKEKQIYRAMFSDDLVNTGHTHTKQELWNYSCTKTELSW